MASNYKLDQMGLWDALSQTTDPTERMLIQAKLKEMQPTPDSSQVMEALDYPLRKTKGAVSGDENVWFQNYNPETGQNRLPHEAYAAANVAGDIFGDPLNALGGVAKAALKTPSKLAGMVSSGSNFINNHYGPGRALNELEEAFRKKGGRAFGPGGYGEAMYLKADGLLEWLRTGAAGAAQHLFSPSSRANFAENAVTDPNIAIVRQHLNNVLPYEAEKKALREKWLKETDTSFGPPQSKAKKPPKGEIKNTRGVDKGVAQINYGAHQRAQARFPLEQSNHPVVQEVVRRSNKQGYTDWKDGALADTLGGLQYKVKDGDKTVLESIDLGEAKFVEDFVYRRQNLKDKPNTKFVVKTANSKETGGHYNDVVANSPVNKALKDAWTEMSDESGNMDLLKLKDWLWKNQESYNPKRTGRGLKNKSTWDVVGGQNEQTIKDSGGLWVAGGQVGTAITEGGIMWLRKIAPNGETTSYMIDSHDFAGKLGESLAPRGLVAISPPLKSSVQAVSKIQKDIRVPGKRAGTTKKGKTPALKPPRTFEQVPMNSTDMGPPQNAEAYKQWRARDKEGNVVGLLEDYTKIAPSGKGIAKAAGEMAAEGLLAQRYMSLGDEEEP